MLAIVKPAEGRDSSVWWAAVTVYAVAIFFASSTPRPLGIQGLPPGVDKLIHAAVFGGLSLTVWRAMRCSAPRLSPIRLAALAGLIATLYGVSDEIHQWFVPGREMDALDVAADGIGALTAQGAILMRPAARRPVRSGSAP
jgi:VanZ family protein